MTITNQAFIKAYRTDEAQAVPASPTIGGPARPQLQAASAPADRAATERSALYGPRATSAPRASNNAMGEKRPLSSFIASTGIARLSSERAEGDFFRPGTTIASFQWPEVSRILARLCGRELGQVADLLVTHATSGRSLVGIVGMVPGCGVTTTAL